MSEEHLLSLAKALSWRIGASAITFAVALVITGRIEVAAGFGVADSAIKIVAFYLHERMWHRINLRKIERSKINKLFLRKERVNVS